MILTSVLMSAMILVAGERPSGDAAKRDMQALQGDWVMKSCEWYGGTKVPEEALKTYRKTVHGNKYSIDFQNKGEAQRLSGTMTLDPTQSPKAIDVVLESGQDKGTRMLGIYKVEGDTHTICAAGPDKRPIAFDSQQGTVSVWKRAKK